MTKRIVLRDRSSLQISGYERSRKDPFMHKPNRIRFCSQRALLSPGFICKSPLKLLIGLDACFPAFVAACSKSNGLLSRKGLATALRAAFAMRF